MTFKQKLNELSVCKTWEMSKDEFYYVISKKDLDKFIEQALIDKEKEVLERVMKCLNVEKERNIDNCDIRECINDAIESLNKEFKL
jgi:hypothetical protein